MVAYSDCEPLLDDRRLERIEDTVRKAWPMLPDDAQFASAIVPNPRGAMEAHFLIVSPSPRPIQRRFGAKEISRGKTSLAAWDSSEKERAMYVNKRDDPALGFYLVAARMHVEKLANLKSIEPDAIDAQYGISRYGQPAVGLN